MKVELVAHKSKEYWDLVDLRSKILRIPLGLAFSDTELEGEKDQLHFGMFEKGATIGVLVLVKQKNRRIKMRQVAIAENHQGRKVGSLLLEFCEEYARQQGFKIMHCNARRVAKEFYLSNGYIIQGEEFEEVGLVHYYMEKKL